MRKLKLEELGRDNLEVYQSKKKLDLVVVLDNIRSGMNVGSVFRTLDCFGINKLILTGITPVPPHKEIFKTAIGAQESVDWMYQEGIVPALESLRSDGYKIFGIEQTDESEKLAGFKIPMEKKLVIVMGNEVDGISEGALNLLDGAIEIEQFGTKHSLNVSVCAGVVMWHLSNLLRA